jgi:hypothetical protein
VCQTCAHGKWRRICSMMEVNRFVYVDHVIVVFIVRVTTCSSDRQIRRLDMVSGELTGLPVPIGALHGFHFRIRSINSLMPSPGNSSRRARHKKHRRPPAHRPELCHPADCRSSSASIWALAGSPNLRTPLATREVAVFT